jgi:plastocyanin
VSVWVDFEGVGEYESVSAFMPVVFPEHGFTDVSGSPFYADGLAWAKFYELVAGFNDGTFRGGSPVTRGQIVNMLWHLVDQPAAETPHGFVDVPAGAFYREALDWAKEEGLVTGFRGNRYRPNQSVTRGQLVNMAHKLVGSPPSANRPRYTDVSASFNTAARWVRQHHLFEDVAPGPLLHPTRAATRGEVVYLLRELALDETAWVRWNQNGPDPWLFDDANVSITGQKFRLNRVTVDVGETVFWGNGDPVTHTVTSDTGAWTTRTLSQFASADVTFQTAGTFLYHCEIHPGMTGRVIVQAPA